MKTEQTELFPAIPSRLKAVKPTARESYNRFRHDFDRLGGIVPPSVACTLLGVSRQRVHDLVKRDKLRTAEVVGFTWVSLEDCFERMTTPKDKGGRPRLKTD